MIDSFMTIQFTMYSIFFSTIILTIYSTPTFITPKLCRVVQLAQLVTEKA